MVVGGVAADHRVGARPVEIHRGEELERHAGALLPGAVEHATAHCLLREDDARGGRRLAVAGVTDQNGDVAGARAGHASRLAGERFVNGLTAALRLAGVVLAVVVDGVDPVRIDRAARAALGELARVLVNELLRVA